MVRRCHRPHGIGTRRDDESCYVVGGPFRVRKPNQLLSALGGGAVGGCASNEVIIHIAVQAVAAQDQSVAWAQGNPFAHCDLRRSALAEKRTSCAFVGERVRFALANEVGPDLADVSDQKLLAAYDRRDYRDAGVF